MKIVFNVKSFSCKRNVCVWLVGIKNNENLAHYFVVCNLHQNVKNTIKVNHNIFIYTANQICCFTFSLQNHTLPQQLHVIKQNFFFFHASGDFRVWKESDCGREAEKFASNCISPWIDRWHPMVHLFSASKTDFFHSKKDEMCNFAHTGTVISWRWAKTTQGPWVAYPHLKSI